MAAGIAPQSSWIFRPTQPVAHLLDQRCRLVRIAAAEEAEIDRPVPRPPAASCRRSTAPPQSMPTVIGPSEPPIIVVMPRRDRVLAQPGAVEVHVHVDAARRGDHALAVAHRGRRADTISARIDAVHDRGLPALPMPTMRPSLMPMSPLTMPSTGSITTHVADQHVERALRRWSTPAASPMPSRSVLPPPCRHSSPGTA